MDMQTQEEIASRFIETQDLLDVVDSLVEGVCSWLKNDGDLGPWRYEIPRSRLVVWRNIWTASAKRVARLRADTEGSFRRIAEYDIDVDVLDGLDADYAESQKKFLEEVQRLQELFTEAEFYEKYFTELKANTIGALSA